MICTEKERESCNVEKRLYRLCDELISNNMIGVFKISEDSRTALSNDIKSLLGILKQTEQENANLKEIEAEHKKINGELREKEQETKKALELINSYIAEILKK